MRKQLLVLVLLFAVLTFAETPLTYVGSQLWSNLEFIVAEGNYLYAGFPYGVGVFDISDSLNCTFVSKYYLGEPVTDIAISGNNLYLAANNRGLVILDKTNPLSLSLRGELAVSDQLVTVEVQGNYAYCGGRLSGFHVIDVSNPASLNRVAFATMYGGMSDIQISGNYAYIMRGLGGLRIADITNPASPTLRGNLPTTSYYRQGVVIGNYLAIASDNTGITVVDVSNPDAPSVVAGYPAPSSSTISGIDKNGSTVYVAAGNYGVISVDMSTPTSPTYIDHHLTTLTTVLKVNYHAGILYISTADGLQLIDVSSDPTDMSYISKADRHPNINYIWASGSRMLTASGVHGIDAFNLTDMSMPVHNFHYRGGMSFDGAFYLSNYIYAAAGSDDLMIFRSNGLTDFPTPVTSVAVSGNAIDVQLDMSLCYVLTTTGLAQVSVYNPESPVVFAEAATSNPKAFAATPAFVYICDRTDGFVVIDPLAMTTFATEPAGAGKNYTEVNVAGNYAYASADADGILIFDISNPAAPALVAEYDTEDNAKGLAIAGEWLYVAVDRDGVQPFKIIPPGDSLVAYDCFDTQGRARDVHADMNYVFVADRDALIILRNTLYDIEENSIDKLPDAKALRISPNPFNSSCRIELPENASIEIFDVSGRLVSSEVQFERLGGNALIWTPPSELQSGLYFARARTNEGLESQARLVLIK